MIPVGLLAGFYLVRCVGVQMSSEEQSPPEDAGGPDLDPECCEDLPSFVSVNKQI